MKKKDTIKWKPNMKWKTSFSSTDTVDNWTGMGGYYQCLLDVELFGIKIVFWRKH